MTGANTNPVLVAEWESLTALILRLAERIFRRVITGPAEQTVSFFIAWAQLRNFSALLLRRRAINLSGPEREKLNALVDFAHEIYHSPEDLEEVTACGCPVAKDIRELRELLKEVEAPVATL